VAQSGMRSGNMADLSLILEEELWAELCRRHDSVLMITLKNLDTKSEAAEISFHGGKFTCIGLAQRAIDKILRSMDEGEEGQDEV
jgi:hypothetical protein